MRIRQTKGEPMNKRELTKDIQSAIGGKGLISKNQLAKYLGKSRNTKSENEDLGRFLKGLQYIPDGRGKKYFVADVAERILLNSVKQ